MDDSDGPLIIKAKEFLETKRKHLNYLSEIIDHLDNDNNLSEAISAMKLIFLDILKRRTMLIPSSNEISPYVSSLRDSYEKCWKKLTHLMSYEVCSEEATSTLFILLREEGKYSISRSKSGSYYFPVNRLEIILKKSFSMQSVIDVQNQIDEYTNYIDFVYYLWLVIPEVLQTFTEPNEKLISHVLDFLMQIPIPTEEELYNFSVDVLLCFTKNKSKFKPKYSTLKESVHRVWNNILCWNRSNNIHKKILMLLIENIMPHLDKPVLTLDFLMESLNSGGAISLLALQGIFILVKDNNLEYPNIYGKLYSFFHPSIFYTKYKSRLYVLANIFLSSTHLPKIIVASFIKRLSRLCLQALPQDIIVLSAFIGNLLIRHPSLKVMIQCPTINKSVSEDPFLENEQDPFKTNALESSLWELEALQNHVLPKVSGFVSFIHKPLPSTEWDITLLIEKNYDSIFEHESKKKFQKVSLTYEKPKSFNAPEVNHFLNLWCYE